MSEPYIPVSTMVCEAKTSRELYQELQARPNRVRFGFGEKLAIVNVDFQEAYTRPDLFPASGYVTDPRQLEYVDTISGLARRVGMPVIWTRCGYKEDSGDCGVWGIRTNTPDSLQNIKYGSERHRFDRRLEIDEAVDMTFTKRMPSAFFETPLQSYLVWHKVDTVVVTGGSTSGCVRATAVESLSRGYRTIVPEECVADKHENPHFANLIDLQLKYADVVPVAEVVGWLNERMTRTA